MQPLPANDSCASEAYDMAALYFNKTRTNGTTFGIVFENVHVNRPMFFIYLFTFFFVIFCPGISGLRPGLERYVFHTRAVQSENNYSRYCFSSADLEFVEFSSSISGYTRAERVRPEIDKHKFTCSPVSTKSIKNANSSF